VTYELMHGTMGDVHAALPGIWHMLERIEATMEWRLGVSYWTPAPCYHGGAFFRAVGEDFENLHRLQEVISADVLDAWFPPSPKAMTALLEHLPSLVRTSPPTACEGLVRAVARTRHLKPECILPGAGSSDLIFLALRHWLSERSRVLVLDPTYGEYAHVLERVVRCKVDRLPLPRAQGYRVEPERLQEHLRRRYDLVVLVNPNSPTGQHLPRAELEHILRQAPLTTRLWVDETYVDYAGPGESLEVFAAGSENVVVCKSLSKALALSGARVAYLCAGPHQLEALRAISPPWAVSLPAQVAAVKALQDGAYYATRYQETDQLRQQLRTELGKFRWEIIPSVTNFLLCHLPDDGPTAAALVAGCRGHGLFLRDASSMGTSLGDRAVRIAVKDAAINQRIVAILGKVLGELRP
jgi:histidinol-phosphate/aromatic aminotransferase/cobyric acid decarboxylase-like protein